MQAGIGIIAEVSWNIVNSVCVLFVNRLVSAFIVGCYSNYIYSCNFFLQE